MFYKKKVLMRDYKSETNEIGIGKTVKRLLKEARFNVFLGEFKKKSHFSLNSGNFYVTLQLELCPFGS